MLHYNDEKVKSLLLKGEFGLEKESLRVTSDGHMAHSEHPFKDDKNIVRDFCENQLEINTGVSYSPEDALLELLKHENRVNEKLLSLDNKEYLWPYSNPPYIINEDDIPVAKFEGELSDKTRYREYLTKVYGKYKMTFCGIHVNYSFTKELIRADFEASGESDFLDYKNRLYLELGNNLTYYGWLITLLLSASPVLDSSFINLGEMGESKFLGMASVRCSELGYWNHFVPVFNYDSVESYVGSIRSLIDDGLISSQTEVYYPVRLKCLGENSLETLLEKGINHIEIRNVDLNPLSKEGLDVRDLKFIQLLLIYALCVNVPKADKKTQINGVINYKNAAHFDTETTKIVLSDGRVLSLKDAGIEVLLDMKSFFTKIGLNQSEILDYQLVKLVDRDKSYAEIIKKKYEKEYVTKLLDEIM